MEIVQEMGRSFLIVEDKTPQELGYMKQMIINNRIKGIINCDKGLINNKEVFKYDITNMKTLCKMYEPGQMAYREIRQLLCGISEVMRTGHSYLLDDDKYVLMPDCIYFFTEDDSINLIYVPYELEKSPIEQLKGKFYELADFLLDRVDHTDDRAVSIAYQFYRMSKEELFSLEAFENVIGKENVNIGNADSHEKVETNDGYFDDILIDSTQNKKKTPEKMENEENKKINIVPLIIIAISMFLIASLYFFMPGWKERITQIIIAEAVIGSIGVVYIIYSIIKYRLNDEYDGIIIDENVTLEEFWSGDNETQFFDEEHTEILSNSETQFFDDEPECLHTISWDEGGGRRTKEIRKEEIVLGKKYDEVDLCISDPSISRRHAKLIIGKKGNWVQDLDSTNGTFVNGNRLMPGENVKFDESSEIRFGKVTVSVV